jgi:L-threonylcarbamoyladenylate synthase
MFISLKEAEQYLFSSIPIAIPTETVWGLAARVSDSLGIQEIFTIKGRPQENPLIIHISSKESMTSCLHEIPDHLDTLTSLWPGPLTLVVPVHPNSVLPSIRAHLETAAFRMPDHKTTLALIEKTGPLVAPSCNRSGRPSSTHPDHIHEDFGKDFPILETDVPCRHGVESTILIWKEGRWHLGRHGAIRVETIISLLGYEPSFCMASPKPLCPGQLFRHYAPSCNLTLGKKWKREDSTTFDGVLGFKERSYPQASKVLLLVELSPSSCEQNLYDALRKLDQLQLKNVFVDIDVPESSHWDTLLDRLKKASKK